jgi:hypothetical protein
MAGVAAFSALGCVVCSATKAAESKGRVAFGGELEVVKSMSVLS